MRIDKLLWFLRLTKTRPIAQAMVGEGHIRLNGRRVEKPGTAIRCGDVLALPLSRGVLVIEVLALPERRGPAAEAQSCYRVLDERSAVPLAAGNNETPQGIRLP
ncbi:RNA-binding S4 domain-containing protein [Novosphingobium sp.]|uniref:RNA-binding S4 domain-containing protein n=1 Tax=Novosphingobium sp. TaxID=1874826 RepID=UPI0035AE3B9B